MGVLWSVINIGLDEAPLLVRLWVVGCVAAIWFCSIVIVVSPFSEMIRKLQTPGVCGCVLKIDDDELLVLILGLQQRRLVVVGLHAENIAILCLSWSVDIYIDLALNSHRYGRIQAVP